MKVDVLLPGFPGKADRGYLGWSNVLLFETQELGRTLVDTGSFGDRGLLLDEIKRRGLEPSAINTVILTHMHSDHVLNIDLFQNAVIVMGEREWQYVASEESVERGDVFVPKLYIPYFRQRKLRFVSEGDLLAEGLMVLDLPGHTPGCIGLLSVADSLVIAGDALKNAREAIFKDPGLCYFSSEKAVEGINRVLSLAKTVIPGHDCPFTCESGVVKPLKSPTVSISHFLNFQEASGSVVHLKAES